MKRWGKMLCILLAFALILTSVGADSIAVYASGEERTLDIGVNPESVTAALDGNGLLTISGSGEIRDFTADTAPFRDWEVTSLKIGADVVSIGDYTFYNCGGITGELALPEKLVRIGERAFSGDSAELAPKPDFVRNPFTQAKVTKKKEAASQEETKPVTSEAPAPESSGAPSPAPETAEENGPSSAVPEEPAASQGEETPSQGQQETSAVSQAEPVSSAAGSPAPTEAPTPKPAASPSPSPEQSGLEQAGPEQTGSEQAGSEQASPDPEGEKKYLIETWTEQKIGAEIFYPRENAGSFTCSQENASFREAMTAAGYREAGTLISAAFDCGEGNSSTGGALTRELPVVDGSVTLPGVPGEFTPPETGALCAYTFGGWTEYRDDAGVVRNEGSLFPVEDKTDLYFIANWDRKILVEIQVERRENSVVFSVPEVEGYALTSFRWQSCDLKEGEALPEDQELLHWADIPDAQAQSYERELEPGDENRLFRCVITAEKQTGFFAALFSREAPEELALEGVYAGAGRAAAGTVSFAAGSYEGASIGGATQPAQISDSGYVTLPDCGFTITGTGTENLVFNGWFCQGDGQVYDPGMIVNTAETGASFTARWGAAVMVYVNKSSGVDGGDGSSASPFGSLAKALASDKLTGGSLYTNIVVFQSDLEDEVSLFLGRVTADRVPDTLTPPAGGVTITSCEPGAQPGTLHTLVTDKNEGGMKLAGDVRFENIKLQRGTRGALGGLIPTNSGDDIYAEGNKLILNQSVETVEELALFGGKKTGSINDIPELIVRGGHYTGIYGGNYQGKNDDISPRVHISGATTVTAGEDASTAPGNVCGGSQENGSTVRSSDLRISGGTFDNVYGGTQNGNVLGSSSVVVSGESPVTINQSLYAGCKGQSTANGTVSLGTTLVVSGNVTVAGSVYGGCETGVVQQDSSVTLYGGTVSGGVYGGGKGGSSTDGTGGIGGSASVVLRGGTVTSGVYGGGENGSVGGNVTVSIEGGEISGGVYGGGLMGGVTGSCEVSLTGGAVQASVHGGGKGDASVAASGAVNGGSTVSMENGTVTGSIYGGGDAGGVTGNTSVNLSGGAVSGSLYGGSKGTAADPEIGAVEGNTFVTVTGGALGTYVDGAFQTGTGAVFGGGAYAKVKKNGDTGNSSVTINVPNQDGTAAVSGHVYGGGSDAPVEGVASARLVQGRVGGSVYGAGFGQSSTCVSTQVVIEAGEVGKNVYGGSARGIVTESTAVTVSGGSIHNVFGGGEGDVSLGMDAGRVIGSTHVTITGGVVQDSVYGGGDLGPVGTGTSVDAGSAPVDGSTTVSIAGGTMANVFGGGSGSKNDSNFGTVFGNTTVKVTGGVFTSDLPNNGNIYGGSNYAYVSGGTQTSLIPSAGDIQVAGSVFGGGNLNRTPEEGFDENAFLVLGDTTVALDGRDPTGSDHQVTIGGALFGSGNLTRVKGIRTMTIDNFTGTLTSIQRTNTTTITNSNITLVGEADVTMVEHKAFSFTHVNDLRVCNSTLCVQAEARELLAMGSYDAAGQETTAENTSNVLRAAPGLLLRIGTSGGYGHVSGVFLLEMSEKPRKGLGVRIEADLASDIGDTAADPANTGAFRRSDSENNLDPAPEEGQTDPYLQMVAENVPGSHSYWRLGGAILRREATIAAVRGESSAVQTVDLPTSADETIYKITAVRQVSGSFHLVLPTEQGDALSLPAFTEGQTADNTFALRILPTATGNGWKDLEANAASWGAYALTALPSGETAWNSGVEGVWKRGDSYPVTGDSGGDGEVSLTLAYDGGYSRFSGGELEIVFREYPKNGPYDSSAARNTVVVALTLEGDSTGVVQSAASAPGRTFRELTSSQAVSVVPSGAVTAQFLTEYYPEGINADNMRLNLCQISGETAVQASFPAGVRILLGDGTVSDHRSYYYYETQGGEQSVSLSNFTGLSSGGSTRYPGPAGTTSLLQEKLGFVLDFSDSPGLSSGDYFLTLTHNADEQAQKPIRAGFTVAPLSGEEAPVLTLAKDESASSDEVLAAVFTPQVPERDKRYGETVSIRAVLTGPGGGTVGFPEQVEVTGGSQVLHGSDGALYFTLPAGTGTAVAFRFEAVPSSVLASGEYQITASMSPAPSMQMSSDHGARETLSADSLSFTLKHKERSLGVSLSGGAKRLADISEHDAVLSFALEYAGLQEGDRLELEILKKTGTTPEEASYQPVDESAWAFSPPPGAISGSGGAVEITVPKSAEAGTYRARFRVVDGDGAIMAEELFNFIVKK